MSEILSFQQVVEDLKNKGHQKPILLLGNGFSIDWSQKVFSYQNLLSQADSTEAFKKASTNARKLFDKLQTNDFEFVIRSLSITSNVLNIYNSENAELASILQSDAEQIKSILAETIAIHHPDYPSKITDEQANRCRKFLSNFGKIYTANYDLLLYWVVNKFEAELEFKDGFEDPVSGTLSEGEDYYEEDYVKWSLGNEKQANLFYLHGALHLYDANYETRKYSWKRTGINLKQQILESMDKGLFPLFVAEGSYKDKFTKINHNSYLARSFRSLQSNSGCIVSFGMSFKQNDFHLAEAICQSPQT